MYVSTYFFILEFQTFDQWEGDGCENCDVFLNMKNNRENVYDCTSSNFDGMIASCKPEDSWVCKWQRICKYHSRNLDVLKFFFLIHFSNILFLFLAKFKQGIYAVSVSGRLPGGVIRDLVS